MKKFFIAIFLCLNVMILSAQSAPKKFSTAGFFMLPNSCRVVEDMNPAWRFTKDQTGELRDLAWKTDFNDASWGVVSLPNGLEYLPEEASGCVNYQGEAWYRKHFVIDQTHHNKRLLLYFEAIMGKSKIWINGQLVASHFGGYLPIPVDISNYVKIGQENVIAVWADNSDDPDYPPGKPQNALDFAYFGGIYRDCWLISTSKLYITDANQTNIVAGGGLLVDYPEVSDEKAKIDIRLNLQNDKDKLSRGEILYELMDKQKGNIVVAKQRYTLDANSNATFPNLLTVTNPKLWSPDSPFLYDLNIRITDAKGQVIDGYTKRIGIRSIAFNIKQGFILNGKPFPRKLIGANRHQDYAIVGNALSNSLHWRDACKLKQAGMDIIRNAHYPQDPAFMDACEELGLFVIVNTPGWQFWNEKPVFKERVYSDIRNMVRRDRNSPSVIMWEPILNETWYPDDFAKAVYNIVKEEYPFKGNFAACDLAAKGHQYFDIIFSHPLGGGDGGDGTETGDTTRIFFTREFGDNVDDWNSHNSPSRVSRKWGEIPMLVQANHYAKPEYTYTCYDVLYKTKRNHIGGALWHSFDHQRGYHPDPFYGGIMDAFRRPKYSYYMFQSQSDQVKPMVFIANEMTPFSPQDVTVMSNCDEVRLYTKVGDSVRVYQRKPNDRMTQGIPSPVIVFDKAWDVMKDKSLSRNNQQKESYLKAEGLIKGKVVDTEIKYPARRPSKLKLILDDEHVCPVANGGDLVTVVAQITDNNGNIKRLNNGIVRFEIEGEGRLVGNEKNFANPRLFVWGEAPVLVQTTIHEGKVRVKASVVFEGDHTPLSASLEFETIRPDLNMIYSPNDGLLDGKSDVMNMSSKHVSDIQRSNVQKSIKEVEKQQGDFGEKEIKK